MNRYKKYWNCSMEWYLSNHVHLNNWINSWIIRELICQKVPSSGKKGKQSQIAYCLCFPFPEEGTFRGFDPLMLVPHLILSLRAYWYLERYAITNVDFIPLNYKSIGKLTMIFLESNCKGAMRRYSIPLILFSHVMKFKHTW